MLSFEIPNELYEELVLIAESNFRNVSAELRAIVSTYIDSKKSISREQSEHDTAAQTFSGSDK